MAAMPLAIVEMSVPHPIFSPMAAASVSFPNMMSTYGMAAIIWSPKNWMRKGAERFMQRVLPSLT